MSKQTQDSIKNLEARVEALTRANIQLQQQVADTQEGLHDANLLLDASKHLSAASTFPNIHAALKLTIAALKADQCVLLLCDTLDNDNFPTHGRTSFVSNSDTFRIDDETNRFLLDSYPIINEATRNQEPLIIENIQTDKRLITEQDFFLQFNNHSLAMNPLVSRGLVIGLLSIGYQAEHTFSNRELNLYQALADQTTVALAHVQRLQRTEAALAETQTLYRAGRVLAGATDLQDVLQEALIEFVYSLGLDQGGITLLTTDRQYGQLMAYLEQGQLHDIEKLRFLIDETIPYQKILLAGQPFVSNDAPNDPRLAQFRNFNTQEPITALVEAPIIVQGETIGWIGADVVKQHREFSQQETDLARAMADQIAVAIENRRLFAHTEARAQQLKAVAAVGEAVTGLIDLNDVLNITVNLIRDQFGFYHVSIFLVDDAREWAVVRASTGEVGKIMVERPHRLGVGSNSIIGFVTQNSEPRIALDVGQDAVHFNNPLLPKTRSEMGLPLNSRGIVIGALDVQSVEPNAFTNEDVETLQVMADQLVSAIENARLFEQTQRRLMEQAMLYSIGTKISETLNLQETTDILVSETSQALGISKCALTLLEKDGTAFVISDHVAEGASFKNEEGKRYNLEDIGSWSNIFKTKQEHIVHIDDPDAGGWEFEYLKTCGGTALAKVPILLSNEVIGLLEVYDHKPDRHFNLEDIALLDSIALQAANAIQNARLFERVRESQTFMKAIIDQIPDPIFIKDLDHKWIVVNIAFSEEIIGQPEENILGRTDHDFLSKDEADQSWAADNRMIETGKPQEFERILTQSNGHTRTLNTRKIPLTLTPGEARPEYVIGIINDITDRKQRDAERERLIQRTQTTLERTQTLYRISDVLTSTAEPALSNIERQQATFEAVLGEYLHLLGSKQGIITLVDKATNSNVGQARRIDGRAVQPDLVLPVEQDAVFQQLQKNPKALVIDNAKNQPLTQVHGYMNEQSNITSMLFIPLMIQSQLVGMITAANTDGSSFRQGDIEIGETIADQLNIWLENRQLLMETQQRSNLLETAAEVSRAASSILDADELIAASVNLIRDHFNFYYVGMFLLDDARDWAILRAGTGESGRIQIENNHRLKIGGESMIGKSVASRRARIALDVDEEKNFFRNPHLPDTRSEMALPLISRDEVIGALTVQSRDRGAFSSEDITLLQTMADQLANAIENAALFTQTQEALAEAEALYLITQELSSARDEQTVYQLTVDAFASSGIDYSSINMYRGKKAPDNHSENQIEQKASWFNTGVPNFTDNAQFQAVNVAVERLVSHHGSLLIDDIDNSPHLNDQARRIFTELGTSCLLILPLTTYQTRLGFLVIMNASNGKQFTQVQIRFFNTIAQQMVVALENIRLIDASQRQARREEIIREISSKIRNSVGVDDILKTTVTELGKVMGTSRGNITLGIATPSSKDFTEKQQDPNGAKNQIWPPDQDDRAVNNITEKSNRVGSKESDSNGQ